MSAVATGSSRNIPSSRWRNGIAGAGFGWIDQEESMHSKRVSKPGETRVWIAVLEMGEEAKAQLLALAKKEGIENASFVALGAFERAVIAYFDWQKKTYQNIPVDEQVEVITLVGDIVPDDKAKASLHALTVLG